MPDRRIFEQPGRPHRLGRHVNHDPRSKNFRVRFAVPSTVRWLGRAPIFDQGALGSCTGNAAAGWVGTDNTARAGLSTETEADAVSIYSAATAIDPYPGTYPPDDTGSDGLSVAKVLVARGLAGSYLHAFSVDDLKSALQSGPVMMGSNWYDGMFNPDANGVVTISGAIAGGHEYLCVGWDAVRGVFEFRNSWGPDWGLSGYFDMTEATVTRLLAEDGDVTQPQISSAPVPPPPPPTPPVPPTPVPPQPKPSWWRRFWDWLLGWIN